MTIDEALEEVERSTGNTRFRFLCRDDNPDVAQRDAARRGVVEMASGQPSDPDDDAARAEAMIAEFPPQHAVRLGGCCG